MHDKTSLLLKKKHKIVQVFKEWKNFTSILVLITILDTNKNTTVKKPEDTNTFNDLLFD